MIYDIKIYFMMFIIYSVLGWGMECILIMLQEHKFVNRGFLIGPCCPIYGIGVVGVSILLTRFSNNVICYLHYAQYYVVLWNILQVI